MHQALDRLISGRLGRSVPKSLQNDPWVLPAASLAISGHPSVVVEAMAKHASKDPADSEGALRAGNQVSEDVPDAPLVTQ
jgi:hypothetical protein